MIRPEQVWVHPEFKRKLKIEASLKGISILDLTQQKAQQHDLVIGEKKREGGKYEFRLLR